ncbi:ABC transporter ATP-binding protein [Bacillus sp. TS-2]|nr:ABC transporter ATP-binding protein [Bacillus sp. TS-2]
MANRKAEYMLRVNQNASTDYEWLDIGIKVVETKKIVGLPINHNQKKYLVPPLQKRNKLLNKTYSGYPHLLLLQDGNYCLEPGKRNELNWEIISYQKRIEAAVSVIIPLTSLSISEQRRIYSLAESIQSLDLQIFDLLDYSKKKYGEDFYESGEGKQIIKLQKEKKALEVTRYERLTQVAISEKLMPPHFRLKITIR